MAGLSSPRRTDTLELLDGSVGDASVLSGNLADIRRLNRRFGGTSFTVRQALRLAGSVPRVDILDVATGSGDVLAAVATEISGSGREVTATGLDNNPRILSNAAELFGDSLDLIQADARDLPFPDRSFDLSMCTLALHHFNPPDAVSVLAEMWRVSRRAALVVDLSRGYVAYIATWCAVRLIQGNVMTRHDGPLSVMRAYTPPEACELARQAGWDDPQLVRHPLFRFALAGRKPR